MAAVVVAVAALKLFTNGLRQFKSAQVREKSDLKLSLAYFG